MRRTALAAAALAAASVLVAGCSSSEEPAATPDGAVPSVSPLTGAPITDDALWPVVAVKVDNSPRSRPQVGVGSADLLVEQLVEGGFTRLAALYSSTVPDVVGPVRSMRTTDIGIVKPLDAVLVASGGAPQTVARIADAGITTLTEGAAAFRREPGRRAPYNLFVALPEAIDGLDGLDEPAAAVPAYLPFGDEPLPAGQPATAVDVTFSPRSTTSLALRDGRYVATNGHMAEGDVFAADTVLVLEVQVRDAGYLDPAGSFVPESRFDGRGHAWVLHDGEVVEADWIKNGLGAPVELVQGDTELAIPPGNVRIELVPATDGAVRVTG